MGQKVHPIGFRLGVTKTWNAQWYAGRDYTKLLQEDLRIRKLVEEKLAAASISKVEIERGLGYVTVTVHSAKPGVVIGKGGQNVEVLRKEIGEISAGKVKLEIKEIRQPGLDAGFDRCKELLQFILCIQVSTITGRSSESVSKRKVWIFLVFAPNPIMPRRTVVSDRADNTPRPGATTRNSTPIRRMISNTRLRIASPTVVPAIARIGLKACLPCWICW